MNWRSSVFPMAAFLVCLLLTGCVSGKQQQHVDAWTQDKRLVLQSIEALQKQQNQLADSVKSLHQQWTEIKTNQQQGNATYAAQQEEIVNIKRQIARLKVATTRLKASSKLLKKSRRISKNNMDRKIEKIAMAIKPQVIKSAESANHTIAGEKEKDHYTAAYLALKSGRYDEAIEKFRDLLKSFPKGQYSDQAYYWLGESYLALNNTGRAIGNLEWLVAHYPESTKHAITMLKLGIAYRSQKRFADAKAIWEQLIRKHADSLSAERARKLLTLLEANRNTK